MSPQPLGCQRIIAQSLPLIASGVAARILWGSPWAVAAALAGLAVSFNAYAIQRLRGTSAEPLWVIGAVAAGYVLASLAIPESLALGAAHMMALAVIAYLAPNTMGESRLGGWAAASVLAAMALAVAVAMGSAGLAGLLVAAPVAEYLSVRALAPQTGSYAAPVAASGLVLVCLTYTVQPLYPTRILAYVIPAFIAKGVTAARLKAYSGWAVAADYALRSVLIVHLQVVA